MKKLIIAVALASASNAFAKGTDSPKDVPAVPASRSCMIEVSTADTIQYFNSLYVRSVRITRVARNGLPTRDMYIELAGIYSSNGLTVTYSTPQQAMAAMSSLIQAINECR